MTDPRDGGTSQLHVSIDLGESPSLKELQAQHGHLLDLWRYSCLAAAGVYLHPDDKPLSARSGAPGQRWLDLATRPGYSPREIGEIRRIARHGEVLVVQRSSLASPWTTVLELAGQGMPVGVIGAAVLGSIQVMKEVLALKMRWDDHQVELTRKRLEIDQMRHPAALQLLEEHKRRDGAHDPLARPTENSAVTATALESLGPVMAVELVGGPGTATPADR